MAFTFSCPHCGATLKTPVAVPAGKKVQCPKCKNAFVTGGGADDPPPAPPPTAPARPAARPTSPPPPAAKSTTSSIKSNRPGSVMDALNNMGNAPAARSNDNDETEDDFASFDNDERPTRRRPADEDDDSPRSRRPARAADDEEESVDEEERPRSGKKGKGKNKKKAKSGGGGAIIAILVSVLLIGGGIAAAFMFLGGGADSDMMAYIPADADLVGGVNLDAVRDQPDVKSMIDQNLNNPAASEPLQVLAKAGLKIEDLSKLVFGGKKNGGRGVFVVKTSKEFDPDAVGKAIGGQEASASGKKYFKLGANEKIYMPSNNMIVFAEVSDNEMTTVMNREGAGVSLSESIQYLVKQAAGGHIWFAVVLGPNDVPAEVGLFGKPKGAYLSINVSSSLDVKGAAQFDDSTDVSALAGNFNNMFNQQKEQIRGFAALAPPAAKPLIDEVLNSIAISSSGDFVTASLSVRVDTIKTAAGSIGGGGGLPFGMGGGGAMPPGGGFNNPPMGGFNNPPMGTNEEAPFRQKTPPRGNTPMGPPPQFKGPEFMPIPGGKTPQPKTPMGNNPMNPMGVNPKQPINPMGVNPMNPMGKNPFTPVNPANPQK